jgi:hypothetical protein
MATLILPDGMIALEDQLRECFGRVVYSHKAHEKTADILLARDRRIKIAQIIMSALVTGGIITVLLGPSDKSWAAALLASIVSTALLALNTYTKDIDLGQAAEKHKETAAQLWSVRESYLSVLADIRAGAASLGDVRSRRDDLQKRLETIYSAAPRTLDAAYARAGIALKENEELTFVEGEIDKFLPAALRRSSK